MHTHTHAHTHSLSLSHTHTHTHTHTKCTNQTVDVKPLGEEEGAVSEPGVAVVESQS